MSKTDTLANNGFDSIEYVDVSDTVELKLKTLVRSNSKVRECQCGSVYTE